MKRQILIHFLILFSVCKLNPQQKETTFSIKTEAQTAKYTELESGTFMQRWLLLGPIPAFQEELSNRDIDSQKATFEQELLPVEEYDGIKEGKSVNISGKTYLWKFLDSDDKIVDLDKQYNGADFAIAYACADITLANPEKVLLGIGSDDGVKIWLNGELVHQKWAARPVNQDDDLVTLNMKKGKNRLVIKVQDMQYDWGFCCRPLGDEQISEHFLAAIREGNLDHIKMFIETGINVNRKNEIGFTPLHLAWIYQQNDVAKCLIEYGADTTVQMPAPADPDHIPEYLDQLVPKLMSVYNVPGVSIVGIKNGEIAWDRQYGVLRAGSEKKVDRNTIFEACSMTKPVLAYLALKLVEQGKLDLDRPLVEYLDKPYLEDQPLHKRITARMVLSHTSGFPNWRPGGWQSSNPLIVEFEPGTKFGYSGEGFLYLQRVIEHITSMQYCEYADKELFKPLGLTLSSHEWQASYRDIAAVHHNAQGQGQPDSNRYISDIAVAASSLYCTPTEYAKFIVEILKTDRSAPYSLNAHSLNLMFTRTTNTGWKSTLRSGSIIDDTLWFGLGWVIERTKSGDRISHSGFNGYLFGQTCYTEFDRNKGIGIVIMTNAIGGYPLWREVIALVASP
jgi:CubicO group peptidase (beta-lactamase class C family)